MMLYTRCGRSKVAWDSKPPLRDFRFIKQPSHPAFIFARLEFFPPLFRIEI
jgi:hypothetical protein